MKNKKGFTLVEVIVSVALIMVVIFYLLRTIITMSNKNSELLTKQEYSVYENNLLLDFYENTSKILSSAEISLPIESSEGDIYTIEYPDMKNEKGESIKLIIDPRPDYNRIIYDGVVYKLPDNVSLTQKDGKYYDFTVIKRQNNQDDKYGMIVTNIYVKVHNNDEIIKLIYQGMLKTYQVKFYKNEDNTLSNDDTKDFYISIDVLEGTDLTKSQLPTNPSNGEKIFSGWYLTRTGGNPIKLPDERTSNISSNISLYAHWKDSSTNKYRVSYNPNFEQTCSNGICYKLSGTMEDSVFEVGIDSNLRKNNFTKQEMYNDIQKVQYKFIGWNTDKNGYGDYYADEGFINSTSDITLYAQWVKQGWDYTNISSNYNDTSSEGLKNQKWKYYENGIAVDNGFRNLDTSYSGNSTYIRKFHFSGGYMDVGWITVDGKTYFCSWFDKDNNHYTEGYVFDNSDGWELIDDKWYYFDNNGIALTGWKKLIVDDKELNKENKNTAWFYLSPNSSPIGQMQQGWIQIGNRKYYLSESGALKTGWITLDGKKYYLSETGTDPENGLGVLQQ